VKHRTSVSAKAKAILGWRRRRAIRAAL